MFVSVFQHRYIKLSVYIIVAMLYVVCGSIFHAEFVLFRVSVHNAYKKMVVIIQSLA